MHEATRILCDLKVFNRLLLLFLQRIIQLLSRFFAFNAGSLICCCFFVVAAVFVCYVGEMRLLKPSGFVNFKNKLALSALTQLVGFRSFISGELAYFFIFLSCLQSLRKSRKI